MVRWLIALGAIVVPAGARADAHTEAVALFDQAQKDMKAGDYAKACKELQQSNEKWPDSGTKGSLAICYEKSGKLASAWMMWRQLVDTGPNKDLRDDAARRADKLAAKVPHVTFKLKAATSGLTVTINGDKFDPNVSVPLPIDPGKLLVEATAPGREVWTAELDAAEGQTVTVEIPALAKGTGKGVAPVGTGTAGVGFVGPIAATATTDGSFTKDGQSDGYTLDVKAGTTVKLEVTHAGTKMGLDTILYVYGPADKGTYPTASLFSDDDGGWGKLSRITSATFATAGTYAVVVTTKGNGRGNYRLETTCTSGCGAATTPDKDTKPKPKKPKKAKTAHGEDPVDRARSRRHKLGLAIGVGGVVAGAVGAYYGLQASSRYDEAIDTCGGDIGRCPMVQLKIAQAKVDDARHQANLSTAFVGVGIAAVVTGGIVWFTAPKRESRTTIEPGPGELGLALAHRF